MNENTFELKNNINNIKNIFKSIVEKLNVKTSIAAEQFKFYNLKLIFPKFLFQLFLAHS